MNLTNKARSLRKNKTDVEQLVWKNLRNRQLYNYKFRRQFPIEPYIADFACLELKLIIELDGGQHANRINYDEQRSLFLEKRGFKVIRFWNNDVIENTEGVLEAIRLAVLEITNSVEWFPLTQPNVSGLSCPEPCGRSPRDQIHSLRICPFGEGFATYTQNGYGLRLFPPLPSGEGRGEGFQKSANHDRLQYIFKVYI